MLNSLHRAVHVEADPIKAKFLLRFFKTGKGEYAEGDLFLGLTVPHSRVIAKNFKGLALKDIKQLLKSKYHEERLIALLILTYQFQKGNPEIQKNIFELYLASTKYINNWDLVDLSAPKIVGKYLSDKDRSILYKLVKSDYIWERRITILATLYFIVEQQEYTDTFALIDLLLDDKHDLIHKSTGWMLREVGKRVSKEVLVEYLKPRYTKMPRTMLRYAIERFPQEERIKYLEGKI